MVSIMQLGRERTDSRNVRTFTRDRRSRTLRKMSVESLNCPNPVLLEAALDARRPSCLNASSTIAPVQPILQSSAVFVLDAT